MARECPCLIVHPCIICVCPTVAIPTKVQCTSPRFEQDKHQSRVPCLGLISITPRQARSDRDWYVALLGMSHPCLACPMFHMVRQKRKTRSTIRAVLQNVSRLGGKTSTSLSEQSDPLGSVSVPSRTADRRDLFKILSTCAQKSQRQTRPSSHGR